MAKWFISTASIIYGELRGFFSGVFALDNKDDFLEPPKKDLKGGLARPLDFIASRIAAFFLIGLLFSPYASKKITPALALLGTIMVHIILSRRKRKKAKIFDAKLKRYAACNNVYSKIKEMGAGDFRIFVTQVLGRLKGFSDVGPSCDDKYIICKFNGRTVAAVSNNRQDGEVKKGEIINFVKFMQNAGLDRGIFITLSNFSDGAVDYIQKIKNETRIVLVDGNKFLEWIRLSEHDLFPQGEVLEKLLEKEKQKEKVLTLKKKNVRNRTLMRSFSLVTIYLTALCLIMQHWLEQW
ncbi:MAG: restriction endonuclease, partial [Clostridia bacterium]|nr:restriction endonuclease [Clostridia bacterium]